MHAVGTVVRVVFFVATIALAIVVVVGTKGSFGRLGSLHFRMLWLLFVGLRDPDRARVRRRSRRTASTTLGFALLLLSYVAILGFCSLNRKVKGMLLITIGVALNVLVIALNQGMPTKDDVTSATAREVHVPIERHGQAPARRRRRRCSVPRATSITAAGFRTSSSRSATS